MKKGAMFGLDARIALAIFGALSVISGAALYSAIQESKIQAVISEFRELEKAVESYYIDTGKRLPVHTTNVHLYLGDILKNRESLTEWKGPYFPIEHTDNLCIKLKTAIEIDSVTCAYYMLMVIDTWSINANSNYCSVGGSNCLAYLLIQGNSTSGIAELTRLFNELDARLDNSDGRLTGNVRSLDVGAWYNLYVKSIPMKL